MMTAGIGYFSPPVFCDYSCLAQYSTLPYLLTFAGRLGGGVGRWVDGVDG